MENKTITKPDLEHFKKVREAGKFATRQIEGGHRSEDALMDLLAYAKQLEAANCRHVFNHLESICEKCGHKTTEDGCAFCMMEAAQKPLMELLKEFRAYQGEFEFSTDKTERHMFDLLKRGLLAVGWKDDNPVETQELAERLLADRIE